MGCIISKDCLQIQWLKSWNVLKTFPVKLSTLQCDEYELSSIVDVRQNSILDYSKKSSEHCQINSNVCISKETVDDKEDKMNCKSDQSNSSTAAASSLDMSYPILSSPIYNSETSQKSVTFPEIVGDHMEALKDADDMQMKSITVFLKDYIVGIQVDHSLNGKSEFSFIIALSLIHYNYRNIILNLI